MNLVCLPICGVFRKLMGCATSALGGAHRTSPDFDKHLLEEQELAKITAPPPKIPVNIGPSVQKFNENRPTVLFIFGGPGSMKGVMVEELVSTYNFVVITTEDIVLNYLPNKVANTVQTTHEIKELLTTDPGLLTLDWVLHLISAKIATSNQRLFLIDIVPNLHTLLRIETFNKPDIGKEMNAFEKKHPCLFSLNLVVPDMNSIAMAPTLSLKPEKTANDEDDEENKEVKKDVNEKKDKEKEKEKKSVFTEGSDEMDNTRMKRRFELFLSCAKPFLDYFNESGRLVTVEVAPQQKDHVWKRLNDFFRDYGFNTKRSNRTVVLFVTSEEQILGLDVLHYKMLKVSLSAIISNQSDTLEQMLKAVNLYVKRSASNQNHLIILDVLNTKCNAMLRRINFLEVKECYLDYYVRQKSTTNKGKPFKKPFKAILSTSNEACLFPGEMDTEVCKKIAMCYAIADRPVIVSKQNGENGDKMDSSLIETHLDLADTSLITTVA